MNNLIAKTTVTALTLLLTSGICETKAEASRQDKVAVQNRLAAGDHSVVSAKSGKPTSIHDDLHSEYTSLKERDCKRVTSDKLMVSFGSDSAVECPSKRDWRIFKEYNEVDARSWLRIARGGASWTTIHQVSGDEKLRFGHFPNIDSTKIEWRLSKSGEPKALIYPVIAQGRDDSSIILHRLHVINLRDNVPRFCGMAETIEAARKIADQPNPCTTPLRRTDIPK